MKTKKTVFIAIIAVILTSCASVPTNFYQVYKVVPASNIALKNNALLYEDASCKVTYDLWSDGGNIGFLFANKTETNIYINLEECFFVRNGIANNYFKNRVYTTTSSFGSSTALGASASRTITGVNYFDLLQSNNLSLNKSVASVSTSGSSVSINEDKIICIPAYSAKRISEYCISQSLYRDCDLFIYPNKKQLKSVTFTADNSPIVCSNRIEYKLGQTGAPVKIENKFYISEISNLPETEIMTAEKDKNCGQEKMFSTSNYFKAVSPDKFYIKYIKYPKSGNNEGIKNGQYVTEVEWEH